MSKTLSICLAAAPSLLAAALSAQSERVDFTLPPAEARQRAASANRLLFYKPIYGGVDQLGATDYCAGTW